MTNYSKVFSVILSLLILFSFVACEDNNTSSLSEYPTEPTEFKELTGITRENIQEVSVENTLRKVTLTLNGEQTEQLFDILESRKYVFDGVRDKDMIGCPTYYMYFKTKDGKAYWIVPGDQGFRDGDVIYKNETEYTDVTLWDLAYGLEWPPYEITTTDSYEFKTLDDIMYIKVLDVKANKTLTVTDEKIMKSIYDGILARPCYIDYQTEITRDEMLYIFEIYGKLFDGKVDNLYFFGVDELNSNNIWHLCKDLTTPQKGDIDWSFMDSLDWSKAEKTK